MERRPYRFPTVAWALAACTLLLTARAAKEPVDKKSAVEKDPAPALTKEETMALKKLDAVPLKHLYDFKPGSQDIETQIRMKEIFSKLLIPPTLDPPPPEKNAETNE